MKKATKFLITTFILVFFLACEKESNEQTQEQLTAEDAALSARIDIANDDVLNIVDQLFDNVDSNTISYKVSSANSIFSTCATITRIPAFGTPITPGTAVTKTIDFGTTGCVLNNGNTVSGKIIINFIFQPNAISHTITYTFDNFYHNNIKLEGTKTITRSMTVATSSSPSHPIATMLIDMTITMPNGAIFTRVGTRTREFVEGFSTPLVFADNIFKITGNWTTTSSNGTVQTATITTPLYAKMSCIAVNKPLLVSGIVTFVKNGVTATLDYGNGICDNTALFTINGNSFTIIIGN